MTAPAQKPIAFDFGFNFRAFADQIGQTETWRAENAAHVLEFGNTFIDRAMVGIFTHDLILVGASSGAGKTEFVVTTAKHNARRKKRVHYFALEYSEPGEIEMRMQYQLIADALWNDVKEGRLDSRAVRGLRYATWLAGRYATVSRRYEKNAAQIIGDEMRTLYTCYPSRGFNVEDFEKACLSIQDSTDLIILDHLHYVDLGDGPENVEYKRIVKAVRRVQQSINRPVIMVAHVRKADRYVKRLVPTLDDFHGTSDIPKIATKAIMLARGPAVKDAPTLRNTYLAPLKCRVDGSLTWYVGQVTFDVARNAYQQKFDIGTIGIDKNTERFEPLSVSEWPAWATDSATVRTAAADYPRERVPGEDDA